MELIFSYNVLQYQLEELIIHVCQGHVTIFGGFFPHEFVQNTCTCNTIKKCKFNSFYSRNLFPSTHLYAVLDNIKRTSARCTVPSQ